MNRNQLRFAALALLFALPATLATQVPTASAGPWTKSSGEFYVKFGESFYMADAFRNADGELVAGTDYFSATTYLYGEFGLMNGLHIHGYLPFVVAQNQLGGEVYSDRGFGDAMLGIQASPLKLAFPTAVRLDAKIPLYSGDISGPNALQTPARGDAQLDLTAWLSAGAGFNTIPLFFFADVGYQHRTSLTLSDTARGPFSDGLVFAAQAGYWLFDDRAIISLNTSGLMALQEDTVSKSYVTVGPSLFIPLNHFIAMEADAYWTPYSRNSAAGWSFGLGVSVRGGP
ncbi:MAG: hypothetical protein H0U74_19760 [Bradymonadaceae bacterium]|nr:hypothetical protein [Lujinxingiaceae bacterium]